MNISKLTKIFFFPLIFLIIFILIELTLVISNYSPIPKPFTRVQIGGTTYYKDNPEYLASFLQETNTFIPFTERNIFLAKKPASAMRGFVIGGSAAAGYPFESNQSFSKLLEKALEASGQFPQVEIINLAFPGFATDQLVKIVNDILRYQPNFVIAYTGENEFAPLIIPTQKKKPILKTVQFLSNLKRNHSISQNDGFFLDVQTENASSIDHRQATENFINNIQSIANLYEKKKTPLIIMEGANNLVDCAPFQSRLDQELIDFIREFAHAIAEQKKAQLPSLISKTQTLDAYRGNANLHFLNGLAIDILEKESTEALASYFRAIELDQLQIRFSTELFTMLLLDPLMQKREYQYVQITSLPQLILQDNPYLVLSNLIFTDHINLNQKGHKIAAEYLCGILSKAFPNMKTSTFKTFFEKDLNQLSKKINSTDTDLFAAFLQTYDITQSHAFKEKLFPFVAEPIISLDNQHIKEQTLYELTKNLVSKDMYEETIHFYQEKKLYENAFEVAQAYAHNFPDIFAHILISPNSLYNGKR